MTDEKPCPVCGTVMNRYVPIAWNCPECDREYWIEGGSWWYCDVDGEPEIVTAVTDGGGTVEFDCIDCGEHIKRERHQMDIPGLTPSRCTQCTFDRMADPTRT